MLLPHSRSSYKSSLSLSSPFCASIGGGTQPNPFEPCYLRIFLSPSFDAFASSIFNCFSCNLESYSAAMTGKYLPIIITRRSHPGLGLNYPRQNLNRSFIDIRGPGLPVLVALGQSDTIVRNRSVRSLQYFNLTNSTQMDSSLCEMRLKLIVEIPHWIWRSITNYMFIQLIPYLENRSIIS